jgi:prephenate dehydrogenase
MIASLDIEPQPMFRRVAIVGCGLIGGSFALALRAAGEVDEVVAFDQRPDAAERAVALGIADRAQSRIAAAIDGADLVVVAVPVGATAAVFATLVAHLGPDAIVTDVGSTKAHVVAAARATLGPAIERFVPGHPVAGREVHGPDAARAELFRGRRVLLTPVAETGESAIARVTAAWTACGARVDRIAVEVHDAVLSSVSHLPHLLAYALVAQIADADDAALKFSLAGGGFRDFTRIAASDPVMWRDIALANRDRLLDDLDAYRDRLERLHATLVASDGDGLEALFTRASAARVAWREDR